MMMMMTAAYGVQLATAHGMWGNMRMRLWVWNPSQDGILSVAALLPKEDDVASMAVHDAVRRCWL
jgi:hypothetical protein